MKICILSVALVLSCSPAVPAPSPHPLPIDPDASADDCIAAGDRLQALGCRYPDGKPRWVSPKGTPYADFCHRTMEGGQDIRPDCVKVVLSCELVDQASHTARGSECPR